MALKISKNDNIILLINKIFLFGIKYYNCFDDLNNLINEIEKMNIENKEDIKNNINKIQSLENYQLFFSFYEASYKIKDIYQKHKSKFNDTNFEEENKKYFDDILHKIEFLFNNIIPNDDFTIKPNTSIIKQLINLLDNNNIGIYEIEQYSLIQNINTQIKLIELLIVNNLLFYLNKESNIVLILSYLSKKMRKKNDIINSIFDNTYGTNYSFMENMKNQFHLFIKIILFKIINQNNYSLLSKITIIESLIWKIKRRNFPILYEMMEVFKGIKDIKHNNDKDYLFQFIRENIFNINYISENKYLECKYEVFKILVFQIINIIKDILKFKKENKSILSLERNPSVVLENDLKKILEKIISFFIDINPDNYYYDELILFFYKMLSNSTDILNYLLIYYPNAIKKVLLISFNKDKNINNNTKLIMVKLLCQFIEQIKEDNIEDLLSVIKTIKDWNINQVQNPIIYLSDKCFEELNNNNNEMVKIILNKYYANLLMICLNKIYELEKDKDIINKAINNRNILNILLIMDNYSLISENKFFIKSNNSKEFENIALFNSRDTKTIKYGKIICLLEDKFKIDSYFNQLYSSYNINLIIQFDKNSFLYEESYSNDKCSNALILMENIEQLDFYDIKDIEIINISNIEIINTENKYKNKFIKNNSQLIIHQIKEELLYDILNEKGFFLILEILSNTIKYLNKEDSVYIFEYFWKFYNENKSRENNYPFMSLEYIEKQINKYFQFNNLKIYKETDNKNESLYSLFNYIIKKNILEIYRNNEYIDNNYKIILNNPIKVENNELYNNIKYIYNKEFKLSSLSFYLTEEMKEYKIIKDNSVMITKSISGDYDLSDINKILENNTNKIKVILVYMISYNINQKSLIDFVNKNNIPIYTIDGNYYEKIIDFFIKGNNVNYIFLYKNYQVYKKEDSIFSIFKLDLENNTIIQNNNPIENITKNMSQYKLDKIKNNSSYKTELCMYYEDGRCRRKKNCDFAHGDYELDTVERIRDYFRKEKSEKTIKYEANIKKIFNDIKEESKNLFDILNLKLSKRLIYDILNFKYLKLSDLEYIFKDMNNIDYIYEALYLEYYFNCEYNIFNKSLKEQLLNYFKKLSEDDKWIIYCFKQIEKMNYYQNELNESDFNLSNLNTEKKLLDKYYLCQNIFMIK